MGVISSDGQNALPDKGWLLSGSRPAVSPSTPPCCHTLRFLKSCPSMKMSSRGMDWRIYWLSKLLLERVWPGMWQLPGRKRRTRQPRPLEQISDVLHAMLLHSVFDLGRSIPRIYVRSARLRGSSLTIGAAQNRREVVCTIHNSAHHYLPR